MRVARGALAFFIAAIVLSPAFAVEKAQQIGGSGPIQLDPSKAYIAFRLLQKTEFRFLRVPTDADRAAHEKSRAEAVAKAQSRNPGTKPDKFNFPPVEMWNFINTTMGPTFDKQDGLYVYLIAVPPGTYIVYGHLWFEPTDEGATCFCMGTVKFDAPAGKITDIGRLRNNDDWGGPPLPLNPAGNKPFAVMPVEPTQTKGRLQGLPVNPADFHAAGKMPNYFGALIDRLPPIPGILEYDHDRVIDPRDHSPRPSQ